ncbi:ATP-binding cassette domain-containing protein [Leuconostoc pseudomesenteroides]|uniref:ATP-binding cassette domain-containing protein n=1 Tax=Leuconostoc pseudomesenteroides TaxID=33968 RepID=UPI0039EBCC03
MSLVIENATLAYNKKTNIIDDLSIELPRGRVVGLVAPNGSGKTTLMRGINHDILLKSGKIILSENETIFFLENQDSLFPMLSVQELFNFASNSWNSTYSSQKIIDLLDISNFKNKKISDLSLGMRQMVMIGVYLIVDSEIMLFDEPINGLDQLNMKIVSKIMLMLKERGKIIIVSSHLLDHLSEFVDQFWFLKDGNVVKQIDNTHNPILVKNDYIQIYGKEENAENEITHYI